jgi:hypothetical protein
MWSLSLRFPPIKTCIHLSPPICVTCPAHLILLDLINRKKNFGEEHTSIRSLRSLLRSPLTSSLLGPISSSVPYSWNTLSLRSSLSVNDQASHPYKTGKTVVLYTFMSVFLDTKMEDKDSAPDSKHSVAPV